MDKKIKIFLGIGIPLVVIGIILILWAAGMFASLQRPRKRLFDSQTDFLLEKKSLILIFYPPTTHGRIGTRRAIKPTESTINGWSQTFSGNKKTKQRSSLRTPGF